MTLPFETLILVALIGLTAGWFGRIVAGEPGTNPLVEVIAGLIGAMAGAVAVPHLGIVGADHTFAIALGAVVGAAVVLVGTRYLAANWTGAATAHRQADPADEPAARRDAVHAAPAAPAPARRDAEVQRAVDWMWRRTPEPRREREPEPRAVPEPRPWFRSS
ncbi:MAG: hypothetical protein HZA68_12655 [Rhodovulum sp.]|nr:hypothetical protein [Rhodovulum sp.]